MKKIIIPLLALISGLSVTIPNITAFASNDLTKEKYVGYSYSEKCGYYLEKEIPHGLEFVILGKELDESERIIIESIQIRNTRSGDFYHPSNPISYGALTGVWWGGIVDDFFVSGGVGSAVIATSNNTQGKASVKPGPSAGWSSSGWKNQGVRAQVVEERYIYGNQAAWDLR